MNVKKIKALERKLVDDLHFDGHKKGQDYETRICGYKITYVVGIRIPWA